MRINSGIPGLDDYIGGIPKGSATLISGNPGTGKTLFACQFAAKGFKSGENCLYLTLDENVEEILKDAGAIGIDLKPHLNYSDSSTANFIIEQQDPDDVLASLHELQNNIVSFRVERVIIDSASALAHNNSNFRKDFQRLIKTVKETGATLMLTGEIPYGEYGTKSGKEFHVDNVIKLNSQENRRSLEILKFRRTNIKENYLPLKIGSKGLVVN